MGQEERAQTAVGSISTHKAKNGINLQQLQQSLPIQNWTIQPQQALQLNHRLNLGADSIVSWYRRKQGLSSVNAKLLTHELINDLH